jgi:predicted nuclease of predicted toxin-antitoxin system
MNALSRLWPRLLLDTCVWNGVVSELETAGHDVEWSGNWPQDPGDEELLAYARLHSRILVTIRTRPL